MYILKSNEGLRFLLLLYYPFRNHAFGKENPMNVH
jgi:hypothetical protein